MLLYPAVNQNTSNIMSLYLAVYRHTTTTNATVPSCLPAYWYIVPLYQAVYQHTSTIVPLYQAVYQHTGNILPLYQAVYQHTSNTALLYQVPEHRIGLQRGRNQWSMHSLPGLGWWSTAPGPLARPRPLQRPGQTGTPPGLKGTRTVGEQTETSGCWWAHW